MGELLCERMIQTKSYDVLEGNGEDKGKVRFDIPIDILLSIHLPMSKEPPEKFSHEFVKLVVEFWDEKTHNANKEFADWLKKNLDEAAE